MIQSELLSRYRDADAAAPEQDELRESVQATLRDIQEVRTRVEDCEALVFGISEKEIKKAKKELKEDKRNKELALKVKLYQVDPAKLVKDDKTVKMAKAWLEKRRQKRKHEQSV